MFPEIVEHHLSMDVNFLNDVSIESMTRIYTSYVKKTHQHLHAQMRIFLNIAKQSNDVQTQMY